MHLRTLLIVTDAELALTAEAVGPESTESNIELRHVHVAKEEPETEDTLGQDVKNSVADDLGINRHLAGAIGDTPNTRILLVNFLSSDRQKKLTWGRQSRG